MTMLGQMILYQKISDTFKLLAMVMLALNAIIHVKKYDKKQIIAFALYGIVAVLCTIKSGSKAPLLLLMFWINMRNVDFDEILTTFLIASSIVFLLTVIMCVVKLIPDRIYNGYYHSLGFEYKNSCGIFQLVILSCYLALRKNAINWFEYIIAFAFAALVFCYCKSRSALIASGLIIVLSIIIRFGTFQKNEKIVTVLSTALYPVCMIISLISVRIVDPSTKLWQKLNTILTNRLGLGWSALDTYKILPFGQRIEWIGVTEYATGVNGIYNYVDSSYLSIPLIYGWIFAIILIALFSILCYKTCKKKSWYHVMILCVVAVHGLVESTLITIVYNPALIALGSLAYIKTSETDVNLIEVTAVKEHFDKNRVWIAVISILFAAVSCIMNVNSGVFYQEGILESTICDPVKSTVIYAIIGLLFGLIIGIAIVLCILLFRKHKANN